MQRCLREIWQSFSVLPVVLVVFVFFLLLNFLLFLPWLQLRVEIVGTTLLPSADIDALKQVKYTVAPLFIFLINHLHELVDYTADTFAEREGFSINVRGSLEDDPPVWADRPGVDGCAYPICAIL